MTLAKTEPKLPLTQQEAENHADSIIAQYAGWARAIMRVVEDKQLYALIDGKKYLEFEAWQLIGTFDRCYVNTDDVSKVEENGETIGYICHAKLLRDGLQIGGATQMCGLDAYPCRGKQGSAKENSAISSAQTWAGSKALKMRYSSVAVLGGYGGATAEEMKHSQQEVDKTQHWCEPHQTNWFKRGRMKNFAHPIGDSKEWCNEPVSSTNDQPAQTLSISGFCEGHKIKLGKHPTLGMVHKLKDGSWCHGIPVESTPQPAGEAPDPANIPQFPDTPLGELQREVFEAEMEWPDFEAKVLHMPWPEWVRLNGTVDTARSRWRRLKEQAKEV